MSSSSGSGSSTVSGSSLFRPGNQKTGSKWTWTFGLPSGSDQVCRWKTPTCFKHCYSRRMESYRPDLRYHLQRNLTITRRNDFVPLAIGEIRTKQILLLRIHTSGEFYGEEYAGKWLRVMKQCDGTRFWFYSRSWVDAGVRAVFEAMDRLRNVRCWWSLDRDMPIPSRVPPRTRLAWMQTMAPGDFPPAWAHLNFRVRGMRSRPEARTRGIVNCPPENGLARSRLLTCETCQLCSMLLPEDRPAGARTGRLSLGLVGG